MIRPPKKTLRLEWKRKQGMQVAVMNGQALEVEDNSFDTACSILGLMYFPDHAAGFRELYRAMRSGGRPKALDPQHMGLAKTLYDTKQLPVKESRVLLAIGKTTFYRYLYQIEAP